MDVLEKLNRRFGAWYENLFGGRDEEELRPRDILRRILNAMEDQRREGLNGQDYVPNAYTLYIAITDDDEREYLRAFLDANELADAVAEKIRQHGYQTRGPLTFSIQETEPTPGGERLRIRCRYEASGATESAPPPAAAAVEPAPVAEPISVELGTLPAVAAPFALLEVHNHEGRVQEIPVTAAHGIRIGRSRQADNDIVLADDPMVSKRHLRISVERGRLLLYDEGSTNGTQVRGTVVPSGQAWPLTDGDTITLGRTRIVVRLWSDSATIPAPGAAMPTTPPQVAPLPAETFRLVAQDGEVFPLASQMMVGRALTDDIVLIGPGVSAQHARLTAAAGVVRVEDLDSPGGTHVNGERIPVNFPVALHPGDQVAFGQVALRLERGAPRS